MSKQILIALLFFSTISTIVVGQSAHLEMPESNVLYRGYNNKVYASVSGYEKESMILLGEGAEVQKSTQGYYIVRPGSENTATLTVAIKSTQGSFQLLKAIYRVSDLPDPTIYLCGEKTGTRIDNSTFSLEIKYLPEIPLKADFEISEWSVQVGDDKLSGSTKELNGLSKFIDDRKSGETVQLRVTVLGEDGLKRSLTGLWDIN